MRTRTYALALGLTLAAASSLMAQSADRTLVRPSAAGAERRLALVVGNNAYLDAPLRNAVNDAEAMAATLRGVGFAVTLKENTKLVDLDRAVQTFAAQVKPGDVALFFYSGHGLQILGENYLVPVDFAAADEVDAKYAALPADRVREKLEAAGARLSVLILDACRNNPFRAVRASGGGLAGMQAGAGTFIALATGPNRTASDNPSGRNGLFTTHLLEAIKMPGFSLAQVFDRVRERVYTASNRQQLPWTSSSVIGDFMFVAPAPAPPATASAPAAPGPKSPEEIAEEAEAAGRLAEALDNYVLALAKPGKPRWEEYFLRNKALAVAMRMTPAPAVPAEAQRLAAAGKAALARGGDPQALRSAEQQLHQAVLLAPWYPPALSDLALAQATLGENELAIMNLSLYLLTRPADSRTASNRLAELKSSVARYVGALQEACYGDSDFNDARDARSCTTLGRWGDEFGELPLDLPNGVNVTSVASLYEKACDAREQEGCSNLVGYYEKGCRSDSVSAFDCREAGDLYVTGIATKIDFKQALEFYERACGDQFPDKEACASIAVIYDVGLGVPADSRRAGDYYQKGCDGRTASSCLDQQRDPLRNITPRLADPLVLALEQRLCTTGNQQACYEEAALIRRGGKGVPKKPADAAAKFQRLCDAGHLNSCSALGFMHAEGEGVPRDRSRAVMLTERACNANPAAFRAFDSQELDCQFAGYRYLEGDGVPKDAAHGAQLLQRECDLSPFNCDRLATELFVGNTMPADYTRARDLFQKACDAKQPTGCTGMGLSYARGRGVAIDLAKATAMYQRACDGEQLIGDLRRYDGLGCRLLGEMYENGTGVVKDLARARTLYSRGCEALHNYKDEKSCDAFKRLQTGGSTAVPPAPAATGTTGRPASAPPGTAAFRVKDDALGVASISDLNTDCDLGHVAACNELGIRYRNGRGVTKDEARGVAFYQKTCDGNYAAGCSNLGLAYLNAWAVAKDSARAAGLFGRACDAGYAAACVYWADRFYSGDGATKDASRAASLYRKACDGENGRGCNALGNLYANGTGIDRDDPHAVAFYQKACEAKLPMGCRNWGFMIDNGRGAGKDEARAAALYQQACDSGGALGCLDLGDMYERGRSVRKDESQAAGLYQKACDGNEAGGCNALGLLYDSGKGVRRDQAKALTLYQRACDAALAVSCWNAGVSYENGEGVRADKAQALVFYRKACQGNYQKACEAVTRLSK